MSNDALHPTRPNPLCPAARNLIEHLDLQPHPEGGFYRETWRSPRIIAGEALGGTFPGDRCAVTSILFLLPAGTCSRAHRVRSEEIWLHQKGDPVRLRIGPELVDDIPTPHRHMLGQSTGDKLQIVVPADHWQDALAIPGDHGYALVGCIVAPGFEFEDFEMVGSE